MKAFVGIKSIHKLIFVMSAPCSELQSDIDTMELAFAFTLAFDIRSARISYMYV